MADVRQGTKRTAAPGEVLTTLPAAMTGRASPAKAAVGDKPVFAYISSLPQPQRSIAERVDALAAKTLPGLQRSVKWGMAWYGVGDGWCFACGGFDGHVKLAFGRGTSLMPVPPATPIGMGKETRGVDLESVDDIDERQLASWMQQAAAMPGFRETLSHRLTRYLVLLRGINVGGKNKVPMAALRDLLESHGHTKVSTYIASGNVILSSDRSAAAIKRELEGALPKTFKLDSELISVLILTLAQLRAVVRKRPKGFGDHPETYHSDAVFLIGIDAPTAMLVFDPRPGVDEVWPGTGVIYSQRLSAQRTKSRLGKVMGTPAYKSMTIRSWQTTLALLERMEAPEAEA